MSWQSKVLGLCKKYGSSAKFAATTILGAVVPGSPAVISLVEQAFDAAQKSGQDDWEINVAKQLQTTADNQARLEQMLDVLGGDLQHVFAQMANLQQMPDLARQMLEIRRANDARCQEATQKLDVIAHRFDRLEQQNNQILAGQLHARGILEEMLPAVRKLTSVRPTVAGSPEARATDARLREQEPAAKDQNARMERMKLEVSAHGGCMNDEGRLILDANSVDGLREIIAACSDSITAITVAGSDWRDKHIEKLQKFASLSELRIMFCEKLSDESLLHISKLSSLKKLELVGWHPDSISSRGIMLLSRLRNLELLKLPCMALLDLDVPIYRIKEDLRNVLRNAIIS